MKRDQLLQALRKYARKRGIGFELDLDKGKGSHATVFLASGETVWSATVQSGELTPFHVKRICKQLGIDPVELG